MTLQLLAINLLLIANLNNNPKTIQPVVMSYPDISAENIALYNANLKTYNDISAKSKEYGHNSLTEEELNFLEEVSGTELDQNPFSTSEPGCNWYCAGGPFKVESNDNLPASSVSTYDAKNAHDFKLKTAWAVKNHKGSSLKYFFKGSEILSVYTIDFYNGYIKSEKAWKNNSRAKSVDLYINGIKTYTLQLQDTYRLQRFTIDPVNYLADNEELILEFKFTDIYPGEKYSDLYVSEINFIGEGDH
ncbi:NADase-type glycan-binding domain-containing protein [Aureibacter tunicatorum]|uniref:NAD glycohydrolase translocation F5/8 type C domain-containing protein n=1 Tax=Aureibacter tunicatorum TaxID=866807 RepID=A0AAE3XQA8_9BACT|nr:hypothetical protein [Aureibacter tunicatorum]MDR6240074.1 hypothetical protein [Aureibacter tunicatorum]BDD04545.1 hypothetical protein AUTU_20280 [Aureibacter tunicatorum]